MKRRFFLVVFCALLAFAAQANAFSITPLIGTLNSTRWEGNDTANLDADDIELIVGEPFLLELYKQNTGEAFDTGPLAGSIVTTLNGDLSGGTIAFTGGPFNFVDYLFVKDGNQTPAWYLFDLDALGWNGSETLELSEFWPNQGSISHVALYGVPIPAAAWLLGSGLLGLIAIRRRVKK
jgi:hypothetical protein